ncbi:MAG: heavy metal-associated domain-containing protein [Syntrophomonadaceae bacterium]|nr:heavy metal-associated domain-containing protein [Syntrophomonadaceae bacterium]
MTILKVEDMHCKNCVNRITNALNKAELSFSVSLDDKTVTIEGGQQSVATAIEELGDLGFEAVKTDG